MLTNYWVTQLENLPPALELRPNFRVSVQSYRGHGVVAAFRHDRCAARTRSPPGDVVHDPAHRLDLPAEPLHRVQRYLCQDAGRRPRVGGFES